MQPGAEMESAKVGVRALGTAMADAEKELAVTEAAFRHSMLRLPNLPHADVPAGADEGANVVVRTEPEQPAFDFQPKPHWEIGENLGIIDFDRGVKISGTRFYVLRGQGARLQRALITFMLDLHTNEHDCSEVYPPAMVREECLVGTGNLPKFGRESVPRCRRGFLLDPDSRGSSNQHVPRRSARCRNIAHPARRLYAPAFAARKCRRGAMCAVSSAVTNSTRSSWSVS